MLCIQDPLECTVSGMVCDLCDVVSSIAHHVRLHHASQVCASLAVFVVPGLRRRRRCRRTPPVRGPLVIIEVAPCVAESVAYDIRLTAGLVLQMQLRIHVN